MVAILIVERPVTIFSSGAVCRVVLGMALTRRIVAARPRKEEVSASGVEVHDVGARWRSDLDASTPDDRFLLLCERDDAAVAFRCLVLTSIERAGQRMILASVLLERGKRTTIFTIDTKSAMHR